MFRVLLRSRWAAVLAFVGFFTVLQALGNDRAWLGALLGILYFGTAALVIVRFGGLLAFVVGAFVSALLFDVVVTLDTSAWYIGNTLLLVAIVSALAVWGFYIAVGRRVERSVRASAGRGVRIPTVSRSDIPFRTAST